jgi:hypothetical protein
MNSFGRIASPMTAPATLPGEAPAMRMPRVRFTLRRLIVAVAIVAGGLGLASERIRYRLGQSARCARGEAEYRRVWDAFASGDERRIAAEVPPEGIAYWRKDPTAARRFADHFSGLKIRWQRAAICPWEPVPPDFYAMRLR